MLFNKNNNGQEELKSLLGFLHASDNFENIKTDIILVEEEIIEIIGQAVYDKANNHYHSENYEKDSEPDTLLDDLVHYIQLPVAYYAVGNYSAHSDVSHGGDGRKVRIDSDNEKMAWEWMINRDDEATLNKAHKTTDRLIAFLEKNVSKIDEWKNSEALKTARSLFINTSKKFDTIFPIDNSRRFFLKIIPFIKEVERKHLLPVLGKSRFDEIKTAILNGDTKQCDDMLILINVPLVYYTLSLAVKRLSFRLLPNGIFQDYISEFQTQKAKHPLPTDLRREISKSLYNDADFELQNLQKEISKLDAETTEEEYTPEDPISHLNSDNKIFRI